MKITKKKYLTFCYFLSPMQSSLSFELLVIFLFSLFPANMTLKLL